MSWASKRKGANSTSNCPPAACSFQQCLPPLWKQRSPRKIFFLKPGIQGIKQGIIKSHPKAPWGIWNKSRHLSHCHTEQPQSSTNSLHQRLRHPFCDLEGRYCSAVMFLDGNTSVKQRTMARQTWEDKWIRLDIIVMAEALEDQDLKGIVN